MIDKKVTKWTPEEREELKNIIIENISDIGIDNNYHISVVGSFANTKMYFTENSDIDVVVWYGEHYFGKLFKFTWQDRIVNVVGRALSNYPKNVYYAEELSHYSLTEDKFYKGTDDEKRAFLKGRLIENVVHCDFCGCEKSTDEVDLMQIVLQNKGVLHLKFICKECIEKDDYLKIKLIC